MGYNRISSVRFTERMVELLAEVEHVARSVFNSKKKAITLAGFLIAYTLAFDFECKGTKFGQNIQIMDTLSKDLILFS